MSDALVSYQLVVLKYNITETETVEFALTPNSPTTGSPTNETQEISGAHWSCSTGTGTFEQAHQPCKDFYPLYIHKQLIWKGRRETPDPDGIDPGL